MYQIPLVCPAWTLDCRADQTGLWRGRRRAMSDRLEVHAGHGSHTRWRRPAVNMTRVERWVEADRFRRHFNYAT
jgi:hypothetical protein